MGNDPVLEINRALAEGESLFQGAFEASLEAQALTGPDGRYLRVNSAFCRMLGYCQEELLELSDATVSHPDDLGTDNQPQPRLDLAEAPVAPVVKRLLTRTGETLWAIFAVSPIWDAEGGLRGSLATYKDITRERRLEADLEMARGQLDQAQEIASMGSWVTWRGPGQDRIVMTAGMFKIYGLDPATFGGDTETIRLMVHPEDRALVAESNAQAANGQSYALSYRIIRADGQTRWVEMRAVITRSPRGEIVSALGTTVDITEQHLAELARLRVEARYAAIVDAALDCIVAMDAAGVITEWNPAAERTFGHARSEVIGRRLDLVIVPPRYRAAHRRGLASFVPGRDSAIVGKRVQVRAQRADGTEFPAELAVSRLESPSGLTFAASIRDTSEVSQRVAAQKLALESRSLLSKVVAGAPVALLGLDRAGAITLAEGLGLANLGLDPERARTLNVSDLRRDWPRLGEHLERALNGHSSAGQLHLGSADAWFDVVYEPLWGDDGEVVGMSVFAVDITDRIRAGQARAESEARSKVMAVMNHEVRTPLNSILGFTELLNTGVAGPLSPKQHRYVSNVATAGRHLLALVNDSLDLSKMASGLMGLDIQSVEAGSILKEVAEQLRPIARVQRLRLRTEAPTELWVKADQRRLKQTIYNLLSNAIKYSPPGSTINLRAVAGESQVHISVVDHGVGIPADALELIFEEFVMLDSAREGTGLGLSVSRRLIQLMGGEITVVSEVGAGTTFTIHLPRAMAAAA